MATIEDHRSSTWLRDYMQRSSPFIVTGPMTIMVTAPGSAMFKLHDVTSASRTYRACNRGRM
jgi:hypothetical protein